MGARGELFTTQIFLDNRSYFFNVKELFDMEYDNYLEDKCNLYKQPDSKKINPNNSFFDYLYNILLSKVKNEFKEKISGKQSINEANRSFCGLFVSFV